MGHGYSYKNIIDLCNYFQDKRRNQSRQLSKRNNPELFRHICAILSPKGNVLGVGYNHWYSTRIGMMKHAEQHGFENALNNIIRKEGRDRLMKGPMNVDILVVRDTGSNSRPCNNCITEHITGNKYFNVRNVFYSHETEGLVETNANKLFEMRHEYYSRYYTNVQHMGAPIDSNNDNVTMGECESATHNHDENCEHCIIEDEECSEDEPEGLGC